MAALWWNSEQRHVSEALSGLGELKNVMANALRQKGYADVRVNNLEVAGGKSGVWVSIGHFPIQERQYWEIVMASGDDVNTTKTVASEVVSTITNLHFL